MTNVSRDTVLKLAKLSGLKLHDEEVEPLRERIGAVLEYVTQLDELDLDGVEPTYQVTGLTNVSRPDEVVGNPNDRAKLLRLSASASDEYVEVPKVL